MNRSPGFPLSNVFVRGGRYRVYRGGYCRANVADISSEKEKSRTRTAPERKDQKITLGAPKRLLSFAVPKSAPLLSLWPAQRPVPSRLCSRAPRFRLRPGTFLQNHQSFPELEG